MNNSYKNYMFKDDDNIKYYSARIMVTEIKDIVLAAHSEKEFIDKLNGAEIIGSVLEIRKPEAIVRY